MKQSSTKPATAAPHIPRPAQRLSRKADLQPIPSAAQTSANGKPLISPVPNSTTKGAPYTCPELRANPYRPGSTDAFDLPSRTSFRNPQIA